MDYGSEHAQKDLGSAEDISPLTDTPPPNDQEPPAPDAAPCAPAAERCDGLDNDCDGDIDEDFRALPDDTCDGLDDDCDGYIDEGFSRGEVECGAGACAARACAARGQTLCRDGLLESTCAPGAPAASDETCDGVDDDCSGAADEDFLARPVRCGLGECLRAGSVYCFNNQERLVCTPGLPEPDEEDSSCDGRDNDCDGVVDEGYAPAVTSCGAGACAAAGARLCVEGVEVDTCAPGAPVGADDSCDGVDDDCDGRLDERFAPRLTSCGLGVCAVAGQVVCDHLSSPPAEQTLCEPRAPSAALDVCDGLDNDCDGRTDEGHAPSATSCGAGLCARAGQLTCVGGRLVNTCVPGAAAAGELDASCDRVDQDCDGRLDEGYEPTAVTCVAAPAPPRAPSSARTASR